MNNEDSNKIPIPDNPIKETNMIDKSPGGGLGFTSSEPPEISLIPQRPEPKLSKNEE